MPTMARRTRTVFGVRPRQTTCYLRMLSRGSVEPGTTALTPAVAGYMAGGDGFRSPSLTNCKQPGQESNLHAPPRRDGGIRTHNLVHPKHVRHQVAPHPVVAPPPGVDPESLRLEGGGGRPAPRASARCPAPWCRASSACRCVSPPTPRWRAHGSTVRTSGGSATTGCLPPARTR